MKITNFKLKLPTKWWVFIFTFIAVFVMASFPHLKLKISKIVSPTPQTPNIMDTIKPKLEQKDNHYQLKSQNSFINEAKATGEYDSASAYIVVNNNTGEIIAEKNSTESLPIASITKLMTATVALDLSKPTDLFEISEKASQIEPTRIGVVPGQKMSLEELLNAALLTSANDAIQVIKEGVEKQVTQPVFVNAMNLKAQFLNLKNSHFDNPQGFDGNSNYSSATDLAILAHYALTNYPLITSIVQKQYQFIPENSNHKQFDLYNWNGLLGVYPGASGVKIGNTDAAGKTTLVTATREGQTILVVVLGATTVLERDLWASELLDLGFEKAAGLKPINLTESDFKAKYQTWKYWN